MSFIMRRRFIAGNWKMYGTEESVSALIRQMKVGLSQWLSSDVAVIPSYVHLSLVRELLKDSQIAFGAQSLSQFDEGAYTGEESERMLKDLGCNYVLVGHSERRQLFGESNELVAQKFEAALRHKLIPILCVGETKEEREADRTEFVILSQLNAVIDLVGIDAFKQVIIAYVPVWAIGAGLTATPEQAQAVHAFIRAHLSQLNASIANEMCILYGGSVKANNAKEIFAMPDVDGGLVGGASLKAEEFIKICQS